MASPDKYIATFWKNSYPILSMVLMKPENLWSSEVDCSKQEPNESLMQALGTGRKMTDKPEDRLGQIYA